MLLGSLADMEMSHPAMLPGVLVKIERTKVLAEASRWKHSTILLGALAKMETQRPTMLPGVLAKMEPGKVLARASKWTQHSTMLRGALAKKPAQALTLGVGWACFTSQGETLPLLPLAV